jgi:uncharacterized Zn finger protein
MDINFHPSSRLACPECGTKNEIDDFPVEADDYFCTGEIECEACGCVYEVELDVDCAIEVRVGKVSVLSGAKDTAVSINNRLKELELLMLEDTATEKQRHEWRKLISQLEKLGKKGSVHAASNRQA